ncbi:MAG: hypothetical protein DMG07_17710, partial [Acidobacteria bacterium]
KSPNAPAGVEPWGHQVWIDTQTLTILKRLIILRGGSLTEAYDYGPAAGDDRPAHTTEVAANESIAEKDLERLIDAEIYFRKDLKRKTFAYDLARLRTERALKASNIAPILELGRKDGYLYGALATCDGTGSSDRRFGYAYYAVPEKYGKTGQWTYIVNHEQSIYFKDTGSNLPPSEWPRDLAKEGWVKLVQ